jgi:hemerythrin-like domain-containing protein
MKCTQVLMDEHEGIKLMLRIMEAVARRVVRAKRVPQADLDGIAEFLAVFVDKCHHGKEEEHLFPALERAGIPRERGPIGVMLAEHDQGRQIAAQLARALKTCSAQNDAREKLSKSAGEYSALLTNHIEKENHVLFPMAEGRIGKDEDARLVAAFEKLERERIGPGKHEAFHKMLSRLEHAYLS